MFARDDNPSAGENPDPKPRRKSPALIDWRRAAWLLAEGGHPDEVARVVGVSRERLWGHLQTSSRFQGWLREDLECKRLMADLQLGIGAKEAALALSRSNEPRLLQAVSKLTDVGRSLHAPERLIERIADIGKRKQAAITRKSARKPVKPLVSQAPPALPGMPANAGEASRTLAKPSERQRGRGNHSDGGPAGGAARCAVLLNRGFASRRWQGAESKKLVSPPCSIVRVSHI